MFCFSFDSKFRFPYLYLHYPYITAYYLFFSFRTLNIFIIVILHSLSDNPNICVISESTHDICFPTVHAFFLSFGKKKILAIFCWKLHKLFWVTKNWDKLASGVKIYVNLVRCLSVFSICYCHSCQIFQLVLVCLFLSLFLTLGFYKYFSTDSVCILQLFQL